MFDRLKGIAIRCRVGGTGRWQIPRRSLRSLAGWPYPLGLGPLGRQSHEMMPVWYRGRRLDRRRGLLKLTAAGRLFFCNAMQSDMLKEPRIPMLTEGFGWLHGLILEPVPYTVRVSPGGLFVALSKDMYPKQADTACLRSPQPRAVPVYSPETKVGRVRGH